MARVRFVVMALAFLLLGGCKVELFGSLPEAEANDVVGLLLQAGIPASKLPVKDGNSTVSVEEADFSQAVALLKEHGLPHKQFQTIGDVFQQGGLVSSPVQERARFLWALGQELSSTISQIDGVLAARVQVVLPDNDMMRREPAPSAASVFVRHSRTSSAPHLVPQIKALVAGSVEGLSYDKVSVVMVASEAQPAPLPVQQVSRSDSLGLLVGAGVVLAGGLLLFLLRGRIGALLRRTALAPGE